VTIFVKRYWRNPTFQDFGSEILSLRSQEVSVGYGAGDGEIVWA
jgi:hypothetical protein